MIWPVGLDSINFQGFFIYRGHCRDRLTISVPSHGFKEVPNRTGKKIIKAGRVEIKPLPIA